jgi:hypothetical protein
VCVSVFVCEERIRVPFGAYMAAAAESVLDGGADVAADLARIILHGVIECCAPEARSK